MEITKFTSLDLKGYKGNLTLDETNPQHKAVMELSKSSKVQDLMKKSREALKGGK